MEKNDKKTNESIGEKRSSFGTLSLKDIASWEPATEVVREENSKHHFKVSLPALQRGSVWKAEQVEKLWDSIFKGYPIGSLLLTNRIEGQGDKRGRYASNIKPDNYIVGQSENTKSENNGDIYLHLIDGQQRVNAITLGFYLPDLDNAEDTSSILWLDLEPKNPDTNTTKEYMFKLTTSAHKWGYRSDENASRLAYSDINKFQEIKEELEEKIKNNFHYPISAGLPIPVKFLFKYFDPKNGFDFEKMQRDKWFEYIDLFYQAVNKKNADPNVKLIEKYKDKIKNILPILKSFQDYSVPYWLFRNKQNIEDIELIFTRVNNQGTSLDQEELQYSIIKSYLPEIEQYLRNLSDNAQLIMGEARMVSLAIRFLSITKTDDNESSKIDNYARLNIEKIRKILTSDEENDVILKKSICEFFKSGRLAKIIEFINKNFILDYDNECDEKDKYRIPKYLRASIIWRSQDIYLFWMLIADKVFDDVKINRRKDDFLTSSEIKKYIGLSLYIHWFSDKKDRVLKFLIKNAYTFIKKEFSNIDSSEINNSDYINDMIKIPDVDNFKRILGWMLCRFNEFSKEVKKKSENRDEYRYLSQLLTQENNNEYYSFLSKIWLLQELLVFVQKEDENGIIRVDDFDPTNKFLWEAHNRPWDYDHILPSAKLDRRTYDGDYLYFCKIFQNSIGNQMALSFSENRSKSDSSDEDYLKEKSKNLELFLNNYTSFCFSQKMWGNEDKSRKFIEAVTKRMLEMYKFWFERLEISAILTLFGKN
ncbi:DUF262 domain-containing protein [Pasteurella sp. PK-2025]|uniref:DUF262 domain-containing protein n=1 Tax=unclassified Pasteurella TaxID=2621516 RepID=UPI003C73E950